MKKIIILTESQLKLVVKNIINEQADNVPYMIIQNLEQMKNDIEMILSHKDDPNFVNLVTGDHAWAGDHITTSKDDIEEVANFVHNSLNNESDINEMDNNPCWKGYQMVGKKIVDGKEVPNCVPINENVIYEDKYGSVEKTDFIADNILEEAEYQGRKVQLGKIMQGDVKKFKVYVKNDKGKVVKVNFGFGGKSAKGKRMVIKKDNPERRKAFRARHKCDNPGPRWKPRYWACKTW